jgi:hypothetical protein
MSLLTLLIFLLWVICLELLVVMVYLGLFSVI